MYDFKMLKNEKIELIDDFFQLYIDEAIKDYTVIITNMRLLILDFPNTAKNFKEDLRASQRLYYIRKKVIIFEIRLDEIKKVDPDTELNWRLLKQLIKEGKLSQMKIGNAWLVNTDELYSLFWKENKNENSNNR